MTCGQADQSPVEPAVLYAAALSGASCRVHGLAPGATELPAARWSGDADAGDRTLLARCTGPTLDVGCGPGRLTQELTVRGVPALGIDILPDAVAMARSRGAFALVRNVFATVPGEGRWQHALLADGNIGIGGDAVSLLRRTRRLLCDGGRVVADLAVPGTASGRRFLRLEHAGRTSESFPWTVIAPESLGAVAEAAALRVLRVAQYQGRWFAELERQDRDMRDTP